MRKIVTLSMVAAASLAIAACGKSEEATADNAAVTEMNAGDAMEGTTNDAMMNSDGAMGADTNMAMNDSNMMMNSSDSNMMNSTK